MSAFFEALAAFFAALFGPRRPEAGGQDAGGADTPLPRPPVIRRTSTRIEGVYSDWRRIEQRDWRWANFQPYELACKCGGRLCDPGGRRDGLGGKLIVNARALDGLQAIRNQFGPLTINSATRCVDHNVVQGGAPSSRHLVGDAFDIALHGVADPMALERLAIEAGAVGVGYARTFLHVDWRPGPEARWDYGPAGRAFWAQAGHSRFA